MEKGIIKKRKYYGYLKMESAWHIQSKGRLMWLEPNEGGGELAKMESV